MHEEWTARLDPYLDGELDSAEASQLDRHLRDCPACAAEGLRRFQWKKNMQSAGQRYVASPVLRDRVAKLSQSAVRESRGGRTLGPGRRWWLAYAFTTAVLLVLVGIGVLREGSRQERDKLIISELADQHVSTLASSTPVDVLSSDRHTVKPWFAGKVPFTFDLPDLQGSPYELLGGRVTYLEQSPGAELVYRVRKHEISVFIFQKRAIPGRFANFGPIDARSFRLATWTHGELRYFVITDAAGEDIQGLSKLLKGTR
jgi:anti-sigma factor RsiW